MDKKELTEQLKNYNFSESIIKAFEKVPRENFVLPEYKEMAYDDMALPIGEGQTISQPYTVGFMLDLLDLNSKEKQKILEVGSGSGYVLALLSKINVKGEIIGVERIGKLVERSKKVLSEYKNVKVIHDDGSKGIKGKIGERFDRILTSASFKEMPNELISKLKTGGLFVGPVGEEIVKVKKLKEGNKISHYPGFLFVPIVEKKG